MCLALAGTIDNKVVDVVPSAYRCLAVEGEPTHFKWLREHFEIYKIPGIVLHGAVSAKKGVSYFAASESPDSQYGQNMTPVFNRYKLLSIGNLYSVITKKAIRVAVYNIDQLIKSHGFDHLDIVDVDVQGAEYEVVLGASGSIKKGIIDYWLIGTHSRKLNELLKSHLSPNFDLVVDLYPGAISKIDNFPPIQTHDGIQVYKRKGI
jgi:FkbM family methyltransferase